MSLYGLRRGEVLGLVWDSVDLDAETVTIGAAQAVLAVIAARVAVLYLRPFGRCPRCKGRGNIQRGKRRRPVCPRCKGRRRVQRAGSRTVHRLVFKIRHGLRTAARYQQREDRP